MLGSVVVVAIVVVAVAVGRLAVEDSLVVVAKREDSHILVVPRGRLAGD